MGTLLVILLVVSVVAVMGGVVMEVLFLKHTFARMKKLTALLATAFILYKHFSQPLAIMASGVQHILAHPGPSWPIRPIAHLAAA